MNKEQEKRIEAEMIAEKVKLLWGFLSDLIPHLPMLKDVAESASERSSMALAMAPVLGAFGQDYEVVHAQKEIERKRAKALYELIKTLDDTEKECVEFAKKQEAKRDGLAQLHRVLGL
jgi:hypothetical protein